jgi:clan AA aspartic protease (TIGR02281 family)
MGPTSRFFILLAILAIGAVVSGQALLSRLPWNQAFLQTRLGVPISGQTIAASEDSIIPLEQVGGVWITRVVFNDLHEARLIIDTGATFTTISEDLAFDAGVQTDSATPHVHLLTAGGKVQTEMGLVRRIRVGNAGKDDVQVVVHTIPNLPDGIDGLLGLSFFDRFLVRFDHSKQQLHLSSRN